MAFVDVGRSPHLSAPLPRHGPTSLGPMPTFLGPSQVLFCYEQFDELTLLHLREFDKKKLISVETDIVVDHYKEEKLEDGSPGQPPFCLGPGTRGGCGGPGGLLAAGPLLPCVVALSGVSLARSCLGSQPAQNQRLGTSSVLIPGPLQCSLRLPDGIRDHLFKGFTKSHGSQATRGGLHTQRRP